MRSLITGLLAGVLLFALGALFAWDSPGALAAIGGISVSLLVWWVSVRQAWRVLGGDLGQVTFALSGEGKMSKVKYSVSRLSRTPV